MVMNTPAFDLHSCLERFELKCRALGLSQRDIAIELRKLAETVDSIGEEQSHHNEGGGY